MLYYYNVTYTFVKEWVNICVHVDVFAIHLSIENYYIIHISFVYKKLLCNTYIYLLYNLHIRYPTLKDNFDIRIVLII